MDSYDLVVMPVRISKATRDDAYQIAEISLEVAKEEVVKEFKPKELVEILSDRNYYIAVAKLNSEVVGYAMSTYAWGKLHILDVAVKGSKRRMGIGKLLIRHLIAHATERELPEVYCEVKARNISALNLFTSLGFKFRVFCILAGGFYGLYLSLKKY
jgi:ribosomal-protein-alanine N-acetyltransferase